MTSTTKGFRDEYAFLSNFHPSVIVRDGITYPAAEHAYQAAKTHDIVMKRIIAETTSPRLAKNVGRVVALRPDWETVKVSEMNAILRLKFADPILAQELRDTRDTVLVENNTWGDTFWGVCRGRGSNVLGKLLMELRAELLEGDQ